jgi:hypothetical protein
MRLSTAIPFLALMEAVRSALVEHGATTGYTAKPGVEGKQAHQKPQWYKTSDS